MSEAELRRIAARIATDPSPATRTFWRSVIDPSTFRESLFDRRIVSGFDIARQVQFAYVRDRLDADAVHYVAFLRPANGRLIAGLAVRSGTGRQLPLLSTDRRVRLIAQALHRRLHDLQPHATELLLPLLQLISDQGSNVFDRAVIDRHQREVSDQAKQLLLELSPPDLPQHDAQEVATFVGVAAVRDLLVCEVPSDDAGVITYEMRESVAEVRGDHAKLGDRIALAVGAIPNTLHIPLYKAKKSSGYILDVDVGEGNFVRSIAAGDQYKVKSAGTGTRFATIRCDTPPPEGSKVRIEAAEHPSKTMLSSLLLSLATFFGVLGVWAARDNLAVGSRGTITLSDVGTVLAIVGVAAGGIRAVVYRGLEGRTLARAALISTVGSSVLLTALAAIVFWVDQGRSLALECLLFVAAIAAVAITGAFIAAVVTLAGLRSRNSQDHPETPTTR